MKIYTIGFTGKTAEEFFGLLNSTDAKYLVDTRLNNRSQLAGFTKKGNVNTRNASPERTLLADPTLEVYSKVRVSVARINSCR